jgi:RNA polymerase sigma factor (sigma-70 family)
MQSIKSLRHKGLRRLRFIAPVGRRNPNHAPAGAPVRISDADSSSSGIYFCGERDDATMTTARLSRAIKDIRQLVTAPDAGELSDRQLLERFAGGRDEAAFALLVRRHGPTVLAVCRRVLRHHQDAEDAFQAAFLVLARNAASVRWQDSAGGWLFRVAYHLALKMRATARRTRPLPLPDVAAPCPAAGSPGWELRAVLDEELSRLPEKYRAALLLCVCEGKTRAEAARELGWKEGAVKIRLERGRELLRARLARRGLALSGLAAGALLAEGAATAALPPALIGATAAAARLFALGQLTTAAGPPSVALAEGVLKAMTLTRLKVAALLVLAVSAISLGMGLLAHRAFAERPNENAPPRQEAAREPQPRPPVRLAAAPAPPPAPDKPLRVLLFADGPTREYQFLRSLFVRQMDKQQAELSIHLQSAGPKSVQDVPPERALRQFPTRLSAEEKDDAEDRYGNLARYDVIIAFDPDWTRLAEDQGRLLEKWVGEQGHGLILVAGPVNGLGLARPANVRQLKPVLDVLPVRLKDIRLERDRDTRKPCRLSFPAAEKFLRLDDQGKDPLAGWSPFFFDSEPRDGWQRTDNQPARGFYVYYPVQSVKPAATVVAAFHDPQAPAESRDVPYLVVMPYGKGRTVYLGSGETWRLRQFREGFHERLWNQLARYAASADPARVHTLGPRAPEITPPQRKAIDKGLEWLAGNQHKDGHWEGPGGKSPVTMTALAGTALLMQGSTIGEGEYAQGVRKALDWLLARGQADGRIGNPDSAAEAEKYLEGHGRALLFMAYLYGEEEDADRRRRLEDVLTRAVRFTVQAQTSGGGWGYLSRGLDREGDDRADVAPTIVQLQGLRATRGAGIAVPKDALDRARAYLEKKADPSGPAAVAALTAGEAGAPAVRKWLEAARKAAPALDPKARPAADDDVNLFSFALAAYALGDDGYAKLLPESKPGERIAWGEFRKKAFDYLLKTQNADGSWANGADKVRATALYLAVLQLDYGVLPAFNSR